MDTTWFSEALSQLSEHPVLQGCLAALSTFVLEDPTTIGCGLLVADGRMGFLTAYLGVSLGIAVGDLGLYGIGKWLGARVIRRGWVSSRRVEKARRWFQRNLVSAVVVSRFVPGMRLPTYLAAGMFDAPVWRFLGIALGASLVWTLLLLRLTILLGQAVLPLLGRLKWPVAIGAVLLFAAVQWLLGRSRDDGEDGGTGGGSHDKAAATDSDPSPTSLFEFWPPALFYIPVGFYYLWLSLRFGSFTLPTASNPSIYSGGLIGESKSQILSLVGPEQRSWIAPYALTRRRVGESVEATAERAMEALRERRIEFPVVAKPDVGQRGAGVRPLRSRAELLEYLHEFPEGRGILLQQLAPGPGEAGVLYHRTPGESSGHIFSITLKSFPSVVGDGIRTLRELIMADQRASIISQVYFERHRDKLDRVIDQGEDFPLVFAGNHCQGAVFQNGTGLATPALLARIHGIAASMPDFYFGRFDIKFESLELFLEGKSFKIIEINGAGAEATHIWDGRTRLWEAYRTLFEQFRILFQIGAENRRRGHRPLGPLRLLRSLWDYRRLSQSYPLTR